MNEKSHAFKRIAPECGDLDYIKGEGRQENGVLQPFTLLPPPSSFAIRQNLLVALLLQERR